ncbi:O-methyltransferase family 3 protein [Trametes coccinea BRFM310]|uniref:O-methyltransferase family 3 protein n=1 Tax=Trametes coccinea (strain BRFM310) TaxID=1353009 RepID=A0A1Y2INP7_TRAC3|nr:O-methyltransferase family 3 protein [Trametes coccinea BRFM310]
MSSTNTNTDPTNPTPTRYRRSRTMLSKPDPNWVRNDDFHNSFLIPYDDALEHALKHSAENGMPDIAVHPGQGKLLNLLARTMGAKRILEVGTLGGYSTIWFARAVPEGGEVVTCELQEKYAQVARENFEYAGVSDKVKILVGPAADTLQTLPSDEKFDLAFIDADKASNLTYYLQAKRVVKRGGVIIVDNVVRNGTVANPDIDDENVRGVRKLLEHIKNDKEVDATTIGTVSEKGYDGFLYSLYL